MLKKTTVFMVLLACFLFAGCGGKHNLVASKGIQDQMSGTRESASMTLGSPAELAKENARVAKMPLEQRLTYLQQRLDGMLEDVGKNLDGTKSASVITDVHNRVEVTLDPQADPKEDLKLFWDEEKIGWTLSFLERLSGDLDFNGTVNVADLTPLAVHFNHAIGQDGADIHLDWLSSGNGVIGVEDISSIAMNFLESLRMPQLEEGYAGYYVYVTSTPNNENSWQLLPDVVLTRWDNFYTPGNETLYRSKYDYWFQKDNWAGKWISVRPVKYDSTLGYRSEAVQFVLGYENNTPPVAELKIRDGQNLVDSITGSEPLTVRYNATGSTDSDGTIARYDYDWDGEGGHFALTGAIRPIPC